MQFEPADLSVPDAKLPTTLEPLYDSRARSLFCNALQEHTPKVLQVLRDAVLPVYRTLSMLVAKESYGDVGLRPIGRGSLDVDPRFESVLPISWWEVEQGASKTAEAHALYCAIQDWCTRFRLMDEWIRDLALHTLFHWRQQADSGQSLELRWQRIPFGGFGSFDGQGEAFLFEHQGWHLDDDWQEFKQVVVAAFKSSVEGYHRKIVTKAYAGGWTKGPDIREKLRFKWLALWQAQGYSAQQIVNTSHVKTSISNIEKQVRTSAQQADITLRAAQRGRRRKPESH